MKLSEALSKGYLVRRNVVVSVMFDSVDDAEAFEAALCGAERQEQMYLGALRWLDGSVRHEWGWDSDSQCYGYYVDLEWAGTELEDALFFAGRD